MAEDIQIDAPEPVRPRAPWGKRIVLGLLGLVAVLALLVGGVLLWLGTDNGRAFVARQVSALKFENGMVIHVGRIDGSIFNRMQLVDLTIGDPKGVFLSAPNVSVDYQPFEYLHKHLAIHDLTIPQARFSRTPAFKPTPPSNAPLLPDLNIDMDRVHLGRLEIDKAVSGQRHILGFDGAVHIADRRLQLTADASAIAAPGVAGGDSLHAVIDASPEKNRLAMDIKVQAPVHGVVDSLSGLGKPVSLTLAGKGDWNAWDGHLSQTIGADTLADVSIKARKGAFDVHGPLHPAILLTGPAAALFQPQTQMDVTAAFDQRKMDLHAKIGNENFGAQADGAMDMGNNTLSDMKLGFQLMQPKVIAKNLAGDRIAAHAVVNGAFVAPSLSYGLDAGWVGFGATRIDGLSVSGSAKLDKDQWRIPVNGHAAAITGVSASVAPLLTNVRFSGDFAYANGRLLSDNIHLQSSKIDAKAVIIADLPKALYTGTLNGRVNDYKVESVGIFNLQSDIGLKTGANGYFKLGGHVAARSTRLLSDGLQSFLGGNALIQADVGYDSNGVATIDKLNVAAPEFRLVGGHGRYDEKGRIAFAANASSDKYGPLGVTASGTVASPVLHLVAAKPGVGMGLADLVADVRGQNGTYLVTAKANSDYGPIAANVAVATGKQLAVDLRPGTVFSGIGFTGHIVQQPAGPFAGTVQANGSGVAGHIDLSAQSGKQRAVVALAAANTSLPGKAGLTVERALVNADVLMTDQPQINGDVQLSGTRMGDLYIGVARANVNYHAGAGQAKLLVEGRSKYPFHLAANAALAPQLWRVALNGKVNGVDIASRSPLQIVPDKGTYTLRPATLQVSNGTLQLEGHYGNGMALHSRLNGVDLALVNAFSPGLGVGGKASGSLDYTQASSTAFPQADVRMQITGFTRTTLATVSEAVDITMGGQLADSGGHMQALLRRGGTSVGQFQLNLAPLPAESGSWSTRLMAAPLSGGIRYNGPADVLASLAALSDQSLKGPIGIAADFGGTVKAPQLNGLVRANDLTYENSSYGTKLTNIALSGRFANDRLQVESLTAKARNGTISASGFVSLSAQEGYPIQLGIDMKDAQLASGQDLAARASGSIKIVNGPNQPATISGTVILPETHYRIVREGSANVPTLTGVRRKPVNGPQRITGAPEPISSVPSNWKLDLQVRADNQIYVTGMGLDSEWEADMHVGGTSGAPLINGTIKVVRGTLSFAGHSFDLDSDSLITFSGGDMTDPTLKITATSTISDVDITINVTGTATNPTIALTSSPSLPQDELMARVLFGGPVGSLSALQAVQLASSLNTLRGGKGGLNPLGTLQSATGISRLRVLGADSTTGRETAVAAGKYITNNIYIEVITDTRGYTATSLEVALTKALSVISQAGAFGGTGVTGRYRKRY
ncbi:translocation/assembly module TamB domain-containing protein [Novosphingobium terrae]|uniref:translocation/assembly module TamB domain-containing protein n=1 Tax=Novosphingobium terrae TaxID=2726189 RepID=UPI00197D32EB|nr:translocation/assembly module TamB domain-containing protein [Novosphingobium terrae]